ncbi:MAG TPA: SigE family RNA polymerase sigma factor [Fimbriimonadaceae bacterium]|nr:SigE family RNA polymerase sigma factor [Fimbriimonadaceae bacterium]
MERAIGTAGKVTLQSFESFYALEYPQVYRAVYLYLLDPDASRDVTQEAFKRAFMRWRRLGKESWAGGWVMTTALNLCRKRRTREIPTDVTRAEPSAAPSSDRVDVSRALRKLPPRQRTALVLFYISDLPLPQIASAMGVSEGTVKAHLAQGRRALREELSTE